MKKWNIDSTLAVQDQSELMGSPHTAQEIIQLLLIKRGLHTQSDIDFFLHPPHPETLTPHDVHIEEQCVLQAIERILLAIQKKESMVVYADYDADGVTAGAIMWETLHALGARVMPYIPHRVDEGYGLSNKGIDNVKELYGANLIITVDHGITAFEKVAYAKSMGIDVIVTDHHVKPDITPDCIVVHTTALSGSGVSWFLAKELRQAQKGKQGNFMIDGHIGLAAIGTVADLIPLIGVNRAIVMYGLRQLRANKRIGLTALFNDAKVQIDQLNTYEISHIIAPRLNAIGRLEHALDALRLLCTKNVTKAKELSEKLGSVNRERQQLTVDTTIHARALVGLTTKKIIFVSHESYNQGIIGLVAGKLVEEFYRPAIVIAQGDPYSKASARSIPGFNIIAAIRASSDLLLEVGGHPLAAGFSIETKNLSSLQERLEALAAVELDEEKLTRVLNVDVAIPLESANEDLWAAIQDLAPFGFGNSEPVFMSTGVRVLEARLIGKEGKHLKLRLSTTMGTPYSVSAVAFGQGSMFGSLQGDIVVDIAYTIDMDTWNGNKNVQLKIKDIRVSR